MVMCFSTFFHYRVSDNAIQVKAGLLPYFSSVGAEALAVCLSLPINNVSLQANCTASVKRGSNGNHHAAIEEFGIGSVSL